MKILREFLAEMPSEPIPVRKVSIGLHWTMVCGERCGLASTMAGEISHRHEPVQMVGEIEAGRSLQSLAEWVLSDNLVEAGVGMAALNAALDVDTSMAKALNASAFILERCENQNVCVVGHFPFVKDVKAKAKNCWVLEKRDIAGDLPASAAKEVIPQCDMVAVTGTALINHSMEQILSLVPKKAFTIVLGPSTPLSPIWFNYPVDAYSGTLISDEERAVKCVQQGATFKQIKGTKLISYIR